jgi:hypothetical protein
LLVATGLLAKAKSRLKAKIRNQLASKEHANNTFSASSKCSARPPGSSEIFLRQHWRLKNRAHAQHRPCFNVLAVVPFLYTVQFLGECLGACSWGCEIQQYERK